MAKKISNSPREIKLDEKNKIYKNGVKTAPQRQVDLFGAAEKITPNRKLKISQTKAKPGLTKSKTGQVKAKTSSVKKLDEVKDDAKSLLDLHKEWQENCCNVIENVQTDLNTYLANLPIDGDTIKLLETNLAYLALLQRRGSEILEKRSHFYKSIFTLFTSKV